MADTYIPLTNLFKLSPICIDNNICKLHYKTTFIILIFASLLITYKQHFGQPINCITDDEVVPNSIMTTYCWINSTFTYITNSTSTSYMPHPGVSHRPLRPMPIKYHKYYQWVSIVLVLQATIFYLPRYMWKYWEGGKIRMLVQDLQIPLLEESKKEKQLDLAVEYLLSHRGTHGTYALKFLFYELLNLLNVVGQIYFTDVFLGYEFHNYGLDVFTTRWDSLVQNEGINPLDRVFPKVAKCTFYKTGVSGDRVLVDGLCVIPQNNINEKIYILLWVWFVALAGLTALYLIFRLAVLCSTRVQASLITASGHHIIERGHVRAILESNRSVRSSLDMLGDWLVIFLISRNVDPHILDKLIAKMYLELESEQKNESDRSLYLESSLMKSFELRTPVRTRLERTPETDF